MKITLNNNIEEIESDNLTISELLVYKNYTFKMLVIKVNGKLIKKTEYSSTHIAEGDEVHVLHLISGG